MLDPKPWNRPPLRSPRPARLARARRRAFVPVRRARRLLHAALARRGQPGVDRDEPRAFGRRGDGGASWKRRQNHRPPSRAAAGRCPPGAVRRARRRARGAGRREHRVCRQRSSRSQRSLSRTGKRPGEAIRRAMLAALPRPRWPSRRPSEPAPAEGRAARAAPGAGAGRAGGAAEAASAAARAASAPFLAAGEQPPPTYRTVLPPPVTLRYEVRRGFLRGTGEIRWQPSGDRYELQLDARLAGITLLSQTSQGEIGATGLAPVRFLDQRARRAAQAANFKRDSRNDHLLRAVDRMAAAGRQPGPPELDDPARRHRRRRARARRPRAAGSRWWWSARAARRASGRCASPARERGNGFGERAGAQVRRRRALGLRHQLRDLARSRRAAICRCTRPRATAPASRNSTSFWSGSR